METGFTFKKNAPLSQINITSIADVALVLLIIFLMTAPMLQQGIDVNLPEVEARAIPVEDEPVIITITGKKEIYIKKKRIKLSELKIELKGIHRNKNDKMVLIKADEDVPYGFVIKAMAEIRKAGIERVGMVTEPLKKRLS
ncbi:MAG: ExbD/TolR family protein [Thermodesulfobacteriota bacterium]